VDRWQKEGRENLRDKIGTAGLIVGTVALIAALTGVLTLPRVVSRVAKEAGRRHCKIYAR
jgi:NTP pyrophosphatase (non-canonical NTP hydrolase)